MSPKKIIPVFQPFVGEEEAKAVSDVLKSKWIGIGPKAREFEEKFADYTNTNYASVLSSCTAALHLSLKVLNISKGEVIVPAITFVSTAFAPIYNGCKVVFADVEEETLNIAPDSIKNLISKNTKAVIPMHYGGYPCQMDEITEIAEKHYLKVIEDAAHACGGSYKGKKLGSIGDISCFSFNAVKNLTTGEGGMLVTNSKAVKERVDNLRFLGINKETFGRTNKKTYNWNYSVEEMGYKYQMNDITAAIGLVQLKKLDKMNERRRKIVNKYNKAFSKLDWLETPTKERNNSESSFHNYVVKVDDRDSFIRHLQGKKVSVGVHYLPLHFHPAFKNIKANTPVADRIWKKLATLPLYPSLKKEELRRVIDAVKSFKD